MKKLVALISGLSIMLSFSIGAMAAAGDIETVYTPGSIDPADGTFVTTVNVPVGDQATLLAFEGDTLSLLNGTNIEYIDQKTAGTTTTFTYKFKSKVAENQDFTIKVGGSALGTALEEVIVPRKNESGNPKSFKIKGTVNDLAASLGEGYEEYDALWGTYVTLRKSAFGDLIEGTEAIMIAAPEISMSGTFEIADLAPGTYVVQIERLGYLARCMKAVISDKDIDLDTTLFGGGSVAYGTTTLFGGEFEIDGAVMGDDFDIMLASFDTVMGDAEYRSDCDLIPDGNVVGDDFDVVLVGFDKNVADAYLGAAEFY